MFQLVLSEKLKAHLSSSENVKVGVADASKRRMYQTSNYKKSADADNTHIFHGREIRQVPTAAGGMGMVLQLSLSGAAAMAATRAPGSAPL